MKRILALLLSLCTLLPLASCSSGLAQETMTEVETKKTEETKVTPTYSVKTPLSWDRINAIPIASADMTTDQLRQICVDFFRLQASFAWTPAKNFTYVITASDSEREFMIGKKYGGIPYYTSGRGGGNLYLWMEYYDEETGVLDFGNLRGQDFMEVVGNHCAHGAFWGWARVVNSAEVRGTKTYTHYNGALAVGPYTYNFEQEEFSTDSEELGTRYVCQQNGEQIMFQSYAAMLPADGVNASHPGNWHVRMVSSVPVVVKNEDGTINGEKSTVKMIEQAASVHDYTGEDGEVVSIMSGVDREYTFASLYKSGYIPFTFGEFHGTDPVEKSEVKADQDLGESFTAEELKALTLSSNYSISNVTVQAVDDKGEILYRRIGKFKPSDTGGNAIICTSLPMEKYVTVASLNAYANKDNVRIQLLCHVSTGENLTVLEGKLTK